MPVDGNGLEHLLSACTHRNDGVRGLDQPWTNEPELNVHGTRDCGLVLEA